MTRSHFAPLIILGSGPAGYSAAIYAARAALKPLLITGPQQGGQLANVKDIENYPGFPNPIGGPFLMEQMQSQAQNYGCDFAFDNIIGVDLKQPPFSLYGENNQLYKCHSLIIATGAEAKWLNIKGEQEYKGYGVSACATCDGFFYRNKKVAVIGGGNVAVEDALYLSTIAEKVLLIHRRDKLRAEPILQQRLFAKKNIQFFWHHILCEVKGSKDDRPGGKKLEKITLQNLATNSYHEETIDGVFIAIGHKPASAIFAPFIDCDKEGYILTKDNSCQTNIEGVFSAGDVSNKKFRQAVVAAGQGCIAALEAQAFLYHNHHIEDHIENGAALVNI